LALEGRNVGLRINTRKTVLMTNATPTPIFHEGLQLRYTSSFKYLGRLVSFDNSMQNEIRRRIAAGWGAFNRYRPYFSNRRMPMRHKTKLYNACVLPALVYGAETWATTKDQVREVSVAQRRMERAMVGITLRQRISNEEVRRRTQVRDAGSEAVKRKWIWARKVSKMPAERWARAVTEWTPRLWTRPRGRPPKRWSDDFTRVFGATWPRAARAEDDASWRTAGLQAAHLPLKLASINIQT